MNRNSMAFLGPIREQRFTGQIVTPKSIETGEYRDRGNRSLKQKALELEHLNGNSNELLEAVCGLA